MKRKFYIRLEYLAYKMMIRHYKKFKKWCKKFHEWSKEYDKYYVKKDGKNISMTLVDELAAEQEGECRP